MVATFYSFKDKIDEAETLLKTPGSVEGQMFTISNCSGTNMALCDHSEQVHVDNLKNCRVMIGACASSIFIRNCEDCVFYCCSQQLRLRECFWCTFYVFSIAEVHIEMSNHVQFGPFIGGYPEHGNNLRSAKLDTKNNLWYDIYDHNDSLKTKENWSLLEPAQYEVPWFPMGACEPALVATAPGSVDRSNETDENMTSFSLEQLKNSTAVAFVSAPAEEPAADLAATRAADPIPFLPPPPTAAVIPDSAPVVEAMPPPALPAVPGAESVAAVLPPPTAPN